MSTRFISGATAMVAALVLLSDMPVSAQGRGEGRRGGDGGRGRGGEMRGGDSNRGNRGRGDSGYRTLSRSTGSNRNVIRSGISSSRSSRRPGSWDGSISVGDINRRSVSSYYRNRGNDRDWSRRDRWDRNDRWDRHRDYSHSHRRHHRDWDDWDNDNYYFSVGLGGYPSYGSYYSFPPGYGYTSPYSYYGYPYSPYSGYSYYTGYSSYYGYPGYYW